MKGKDWLRRLGKLRVNRAVSPPSPHKPLFLLCFLDLFEAGQFRDGNLQLTPELYLRFQSCWAAVQHRTKQPPLPQFPFHHLSGDGLWQTFMAEGKPSYDDKTTRLSVLDPDFLAFLGSAANRDAARHLLVREHFTDKEQVALREALGMPASELLSPAPSLMREEFVEAQQEGRDARFRIRVVHGYLFTCALTGHRLVTAGGASLVEAAHIHAFADSRNNAPENGLALSRNAHWLFDQGLWTVDTPRMDQYVIRVAHEQFEEASAFDHGLRLFDGRPLLFAPGTKLRPDPAHFAWHRAKRFGRAGERADAW
jgi:putative restriction endonuclease